MQCSEVYSVLQIEALYQACLLRKGVLFYNVAPQGDFAGFEPQAADFS